MKRITIIVVFLIGAFGYSNAQIDTVKLIVKKIFYDKKVFDKIFFQYEPMEDWPHSLPRGTYAFIFPDTIFSKKYPYVLIEIAGSWGTHKIVRTLPYIVDSVGSIYIKVELQHQQIKNFVMFDKIESLSGSKFHLDFKITSFRYDKRLTNRYYSIKSTVIFVGGVCQIKKLRVKKYRWVKPFPTID